MECFWLSFIRNSKIGTRVRILTFIACVVILTLTSIGFLSIQKINKTSNDMYQNHLLPVQWIESVQSNMYQINKDLMEFLLSKDENRKQELTKEMGEIREANDKLLKKFEAQINLDKEKEVLQAFRKLFNETRPKLKTVQELAQSNTEEAYTYYVKEIGPNLQKLIVMIQELTLDNNDAVQQLYKENDTDVKNTIFTFITISVLAIICLVGIGYMIRKAISKPIALLQRDMGQVAAGNLTIRTSYTSKNELGSIVQSFNAMLDNLQQLIGNVKVTTQEVISSTDAMLQDAKQASNISKEVVQTISEMNVKIENQVTGIQESSSSMEEISTGVQTVADSSSTVAEVAVTTTERVDSGSKVVKQSILQLNNVHEVVEETSKAIDHLVLRIQKIDTALNAITHIAEQTNLLALNAAIEAARAGENGKGFAVVASEIRDLAEQSKKSAKEINHLIQSIQQDTQHTVLVMQRGTEKAAEGKESALTADQAFSSIMEDINRITSQIQEVSVATEEISAATEEVNASLSAVSETSTQVSEGTSQTGQLIQKQAMTIQKISTNSNDMKKKVEDLEKIVEQFIIKN